MFDDPPVLWFGLKLQAAVEAYQALQVIVQNEIDFGSDIAFMRRRVAIEFALADRMIYSINQAYRICEHGKPQIVAPGFSRKSFLYRMRRLRQIRDVSEHFADYQKDSPKLTFADHDEESVRVDEASLVIVGPERILRGELNLYDVYVYCKETVELVAPVMRSSHG
jgi:hypothetical protein